MRCERSRRPGRCLLRFFSNFGAAYTSKIIDVPASTGYGEPIQKQFKLKDGEKIVAAMSLDPRVAGHIAPKKEGDPAPVHAVAVSSDGYALRFNLDGFVEPSTRAGRRYAEVARLPRVSVAARRYILHARIDRQDAGGGQAVRSSQAGRPVGR